MKNLLNTLAGAVTLAFVHLLLELWRAFMDMVFVLPDFSGGAAGTVALIGVVYTLVFSGWLLALRQAGGGSRRGVFAAIAFGLLFWIGVDISTIFFYCPGGCEEAFFDYATYAAILVGGAALFSLARNLKSTA